jgi:hypothetical protein
MNHFSFSVLLLLHASLMHCKSRTTIMKSEFDKDLSKGPLNTQLGERHRIRQDDGPMMILKTCSFKVQVGTSDTCSSIAQNFGLTLDVFIVVNPGINCEALPSSVCVDGSGVEGPQPTTGIADTTGFANSTGIANTTGIAAWDTTGIAEETPSSPPSESTPPPTPAPPPTSPQTAPDFAIPLGATSSAIAYATGIAVETPPPGKAPPLIDGCVAFWTVTVEPDNTCDFIIIALQISREALVAINPALDCNAALVVGSQVCIVPPNTPSPPPPSPSPSPPPPPPPPPPHSPPVPIEGCTSF